MYLVSLRDSEGSYRHWGMAYTFGDEASTSAVQSAHTEALNTVLRKPLSELWRELANSNKSGFSLKQQLQTILKAGSNALPPGCSEVAACHFSSVIHVLCELAELPAGTSNRPAA